MPRRLARNPYGRSSLKCFSGLILRWTTKLWNHNSVGFKFQHDVKSKLNFKIMPFHCSDTRANRRKTASKIDRWISKFRIFDYFANENFLISGDHFGSQSPILFACRLVSLLVLCCSLHEQAARRVPNAAHDAVATRSQWDKLSALPNLGFQNFEILEININLSNLQTCFSTS